MKLDSPTAKDIDEYIAQFPEDVRECLESVRQAIRRAAPAAAEKISYQIPTFTLQGNLVHFAAFKHHLGFYPGASGIEQFRGELSAYETAKGTVRFPLAQPMPLELIERIVRFRVKENQEAAAARRKR